MSAPTAVWVIEVSGTIRRLNPRVSDERRARTGCPRGRSRSTSRAGAARRMVVDSRANSKIRLEGSSWIECRQIVITGLKLSRACGRPLQCTDGSRRRGPQVGSARFVAGARAEVAPDPARAAPDPPRGSASSPRPEPTGPRPAPDPRCSQSLAVLGEGRAGVGEVWLRLSELGRVWESDQRTHTYP